MSNVVIFKDGEVKYLKSVHTPDYLSNPDAIINPNIPIGVPIKYWKRNGDIVLEMDTSEKNAVDIANAPKDNTALINSIKTKTSLNDEEIAYLRGI